MLPSARKMYKNISLQFNSLSIALICAFAAHIFFTLLTVFNFDGVIEEQFFISLQTLLVMTASTSSLPVSLNYKIIPQVSVSVRAMRFSGILSRCAITSQHIFAVSNRFNMRGINASRIFTKMVAFQTRRNNFNKQLVSDSMRESFYAFIAKHSIAFIVAVILPFPTRNASVKVDFTNLDFREKTHEKLAVNRKSIKILVSHLISPIQKLNRLGLDRCCNHLFKPFVVLSSILPQNCRNISLGLTEVF